MNGLHWDYIGIMEKNTEATIMGLCRGYIYIHICPTQMYGAKWRISFLKCPLPEVSNFAWGVNPKPYSQWVH